MAPIGWSFFAGTIAFHVVQVLIDGLHGQINSLGQHVGVVFQQHEAEQGIGVAPRCPVVEQSILLVVPCHPPKIVALEERRKFSLLQLVTQPRGNHRINLIKRFLQEVVGPRKHLRNVSLAQLKNVLSVIRHGPFALLSAEKMGRLCPRSHLAEEHDTVYQVVYEASLALGKLGYKQMTKDFDVLIIGVLHGVSTARAFIFQIIGRPDNLPVIVKKLRTGHNDGFFFLSEKLIPVCTVSVFRERNPCLFHNK